MVAHGFQNRDRHESVELVVGYDGAVLAWHAKHTGQDPLAIQSGTFVAIGLALSDNLIASVLYTRYRYADIEIHIHSTDKRWCTRRTLRYIFTYPFLQLGCRRVSAVTDPANTAVCHFLKRIGFIEEGRKRQALPNGNDELMLGMLREECKWVVL